MKKIFYLSLLGITLFSSACSDYLEQSSDSEADVEFIFSDVTTARAALNQAYETWRGKANIHSGGLFYDVVSGGSDIECQPELFATSPGRWTPSNLYGAVDATRILHGTANFPIASQGNFETTWTNLYNIISITNTLINSFEQSGSYDKFKEQAEPSELSEIYGEAVALRASCYHELIRFYGDVPHQLEAGAEVTGLTPRDVIAEFQINKLIEVEPWMYRVGEHSSVTRAKMNRTYVQGLIARMALIEGGYQARRDDIDYVDLEGNAISFEKVAQTPANQCFYGRPTNWQDWYKLAEKYLTAAVENPGSVHLQTTDPRSKGANGQEYDNPFQYVFQQMMMGDGKYADENVYEIPETYASSSDRIYNWGRPSTGGGSNAFPCKAYGQGRFAPIYFYDDFEPNDLRRDVTCAITGSAGNGAETVIPFDKGNTAAGGGIGVNKWDENRMDNPYILKSRKSGVNCPYLRFADILLMLAEVKATLGDNGAARNYLAMVRNRAFKSETEADVDGFITKCGSLLDAVLEERKLEFGGEGMRRYDLIRTNTIGKAVKSFHERTGAMIADLESKGWHQFDNGNVISSYIWYKLVDPAEYGIRYRLTTTCTDKTNPVLYPGWRGQNDDWASVAASNGTPTNTLTAGKQTNVAIKGLFEYIDPAGIEAQELERNGWIKMPWGAKIVEQKEQYNDYVFDGYVEGEVPIYLCCIHANIIKNANGALTNGYGFANE